VNRRAFPRRKTIEGRVQRAMRPLEHEIFGRVRMVTSVVTNVIKQR
jgi:hypothetical protein